MARRTSGKKGRDRDLLYIASFIVFDAIVFHQVIAAANPTIEPIARAETASSRQDFFDRQWTEILRIDFAPVFLLARDVLRSFPTSPTTERVLQQMVGAATSVLSSGVLLKHDFMGRLYHKLLLRTTGRYYATYYTSVPAATLLGELSIRTPNPQWDLASLKSISKFRAIDPACGSGTLVSAAYSAIRDAYILAGAATTPADLSRLHKVLVESVLHGWDILDFAAHLTLTTLSLHSETVNIRASNVFALPAGVGQDGRIHLGSLDYLQPQESFSGRGFTPSAQQKSLADNREAEIAAQDYDLVMMNPPFSRSAKPNLKFGYADPKAREKMNRKLGLLAKSLGASGISKAGLGAYFMLLGLKLAKSEGSRISIVIPRSMLSGVSWAVVRRHYLQHCEIEYVVSNYDPGDSAQGIDPWAWSENTKLGEVLIVARTTKAPQKERHTTFVNLWRKPSNEVEAVLIANQVVRRRDELKASIEDHEYLPLDIRSVSYGAIYRLPQSRLAVSWLAPCVFADPELNELVLRILKLPNMTTLPAVAKSMGSDIKQVKDHFAPSTALNATPVVWGHQGHMRTIQMAVDDVQYGTPKKGAASLRLHTGNAASFILAERPHLSTERLLAMSTAVDVLTTAFWEIQLRNPAARSVLLLWLNSTYGFLQYLASATSSMGDIFKFKKGQMLTLPVVNPDTIDPVVLTEADVLLASVQDKPVLVYSHEFGLAATGRGVRHEIDQFFVAKLGLQPISSAQYMQIARDPILTMERR